MKSIHNLGDSPAGIPLAADELLEFHAARLLLLFRFCGTANRIDGLTKMAKLDFFVRYPQFFDRACEVLGFPAKSTSESVESSMIRFHYGPWDDRYYHILSFLESRGLLEVSKHKNAYRLTLTESGKSAANEMAKDSSFNTLIEQMKLVKKTLGKKAGSALKNLIYDIFEKEVGQRSMREVIQ
ncbi:MAG TPA: hypothetical protein DCM07_27460 [Planctomycetaceae bacterium]|uniref:hypothetical protein n=1 Tax=Gimesia sp. TaxID=2024833 RepID=UPI000C67B76B|nr:hypothetical protein [Gimesia sp.]MAX37637.1 hypothetical protein [Gimesia sp.]HAH48514.1 hypothetical protein [Planctomycetaceae bacterium]|tara:strand:+ start:1718 stop:2266 length:549 start_codon:yes stop_codon:yes gene_type:complete